MCNFEQIFYSYIERQSIKHLMEKFNLSHPTAIQLKKREDVRIPISCIPSLLKEMNLQGDGSIRLG